MLALVTYSMNTNADKKTNKIPISSALDLFCCLSSSFLPDLVQQLLLLLRPIIPWCLPHVPHPALLLQAQPSIRDPASPPRRHGLCSIRAYVARVT